MPSRFRVAAPALLVLLSAPLLIYGQSDRPLFSEEVRRVVDEEGVDAARQQLPMLFATSQTKYEMDADGMVALGREYLDEGEAELAVIVLQIATIFDPRSSEATAALSEAVASERDTRSRVASESESPSDDQMAEQKMAGRDLGPKRDDLDRFKGQWADPNRSNQNHVFWINETCAGSGYLWVAPAWADIAPWALKSGSDLLFIQPYPSEGQQPVRLEFQSGSDGAITGALISGPVDGKLERLGDLPEGSQSEGSPCLYP